MPPKQAHPEVNRRWPTIVGIPEEASRDPSRTPARTEVAVVGAGPTGLALAVTLARAGIDFVLLDRQAEGANTSRAAVVHARTLEVLDELDPSGALCAELIGAASPSPGSGSATAPAS